MKNLMRSFIVVTIAALLVGIASVPSDAAPRVSARGRFNGIWSVVIYTLYGDCDRALRYSLLIQDGRVQSRDPSYQAYGRVAPSGAIRVTVAQGNRSAGGSGRLVGNSGRGQWRTDNGSCAGRWIAERRAVNY